MLWLLEREKSFRKQGRSFQQFKKQQQYFLFSILSIFFYFLIDFVLYSILFYFLFYFCFYLLYFLFFPFSIFHCTSFIFCILFSNTFSLNYIYWTIFYYIERKYQNQLAKKNYIHKFLSPKPKNHLSDKIKKKYRCYLPKA